MLILSLTMLAVVMKSHNLNYDGVIKTLLKGWLAFPFNLLLLESCENIRHSAPVQRGVSVIEKNLENWEFMVVLESSFMALYAENC